MEKKYKNILEIVKINLVNKLMDVCIKSIIGWHKQPKCEIVWIVYIIIGKWGNHQNHILGEEVHLKN